MIKTKYFGISIDAEFVPVFRRVRKIAKNNY